MVRVSVFIGVAMAIAAAGCERVKSANPTSPSIAGPIPGVSISAPLLVEPAMGAQLVPEGSPITLVIGNSTTSGQRALWLRLELAADGNFQQVLHQADRIEPAEGTQTSYRMPAPLGAGHTYYWRARAEDGANAGPFSAVGSFSIVEPVIIDTPVPLQPIGTITTNRPEFKARNGRIIGTSGVVYRFEVGTAPDPSSMIAIITTSPGSDGTTSMSLGDLQFDKTYYWRTYATDGTTASAYSAVTLFTTPKASTGGGGGGGGGGGTGPIGSPRTISPDEALSIIRNVHDAEGWDLGSRSSRDQRIEFIQRAVAAVHYGHGRYNNRGPDSNWCIKDAGGGRPISDDVIVRCNSREAYDLIGSAGADGYSFHVDYIGVLPGNQNVFAPPRSSLPQ